ncbi:MAG: hypothetical protein AAF614_44505 [Chloroflexota bacterium]
MAQHNALIIYTTMEMAEMSKAKINVEGVDIFPAATLDDVKRIFEETLVDVVLLGCGPEDLASRLQIIKYIKTWSYSAGKGPSIHFLGESRHNAIAFINAVLKSDLLNIAITHS